MTLPKDRIISLDLNADLSRFADRYAGCLILTHDGQILVQQRGEDWDRYPGFLTEFGGRIEPGEVPLDAIIRELKEELGGIVHPQDVLSLGVMTEQVSQYTELLYVYFWQDKNKTITGCYEGEARFYASLQDVLKHPKKMDSLCWLLDTCQKRRLIR